MGFRKLLLSLSTAALLFVSLGASAFAAPLALLLPAPQSPAIYKLPYPAGMTFRVCQGNNTGTHTGRGAYAWDFCMPVGTPVSASRAGTVSIVEQRFDGNGWGAAFANKNNYIVVDHGDGTAALYMHLMHNGVVVQVGQVVQAGQVLAYSGNTGWSAVPHTHFMVMQASSYDWYTQSMPVAFADIPGDGAPRAGNRYTSGNATVDSSVISAVCDQPKAGSGFAPFWVESFRPSNVWSGSDGSAVSFGAIMPWQFFQVVAPQAGSRLLVRVAATGGLAFVPAADVGPSGPPSVGACMSSQAH